MFRMMGTVDYGKSASLELCSILIVYLAGKVCNVLIKEVSLFQG